MQWRASKWIHEYGTLFVVFVHTIQLAPLPDNAILYIHFICTPYSTQRSPQHRIRISCSLFGWLIPFGMGCSMVALPHSPCGYASYFYQQRCPSVDAYAIPTCSAHIDRFAVGISLVFLFVPFFRLPRKSGRNRILGQPVCIWHNWTRPEHIETMHTNVVFARNASRPLAYAGNLLVRTALHCSGRLVLLIIHANVRNLIDFHRYPPISSQ